MEPELSLPYSHGLATCRIILKWILNKLDVFRLDSTGLEMGPVADSYEASSSIKGGEFLNYLSDY
jgi:hypothetical protein